jgi:hypothetical protein
MYTTESFKMLAVMDLPANWHDYPECLHAFFCLYAINDIDFSIFVTTVEKLLTISVFILVTQADCLFMLTICMFGWFLFSL